MPALPPSQQDAFELSFSIENLHSLFISDNIDISATSDYAEYNGRKRGCQGIL
jgi:hypothetical protein